MTRLTNDALSRHLGRLLAPLSVLLLTACGGGAADSSGTAGTGGSSSASGSSSGTGGAAVDRGPTSITLDADANGLWWDAASATLYIADDANNRILSWTDAAGSKLVANLPAQTQSDPGLGQVIMTTDGKLYVTRFGYGTTGDVAYVNPDLTSAVVPNLDPTRRRIGLTVAADGTLYDGYFVKTATSQIGAVAQLDVTSGSETDVVTALSKPVGVLASGTNLLVDDQDTNEVLEAPLASLSMVTAFVPVLTVPDLLGNGPDGTYFTGGTNGDIRQISSAGAVTTFAGGFLQIRGVAYDAQNKRLFAAEHDPAGLKNALHILPVN
jgi:hypothetical protein